MSLERGTSAAKEGDAPIADLASHDEVVLGSHKHVKLRRLPFYHLRLVGSFSFEES